MLFCLAGCTAQDDLMALANEKNRCKAFKIDYDKVGVLTPTSAMKSKIDLCKSIGAW